MAMEMEEDISVEESPETEETPQVEENNMDMFDGPIPGASLTEELGTEAHERPPVFTDPDEAYEFVMNKIQSPDAFERIMISAKLDIPVELTVRAIVFSGWALGQYTHEIMILIFGPVFDAVLDLLDEQDIKYIALAERAEDEQLEEAMQELERYEEFKSDMSVDSEEAEVEPEIEPEEEPEEESEVEVPNTGLMGRRE